MTSLGEVQPKGFPETFPFPMLTGPGFPSQSRERTSGVVNTDARGSQAFRRNPSGPGRPLSAHRGRSLPTEASWATPRRCFSGPRKAWSNESILGARNRAGAPGRSTSAPPDPALQKMKPGVPLFEGALRVNLGCNCVLGQHILRWRGLCVSSSFWAQTGHEGRAGARALLRMPCQRLRAQPDSSAGGRHIQGSVGLTCVFSPNSYLTTPSSFPQPCLSLPSKY